MSGAPGLPRVGIDLRGLQKTFKSHEGRGIGRYVRSLVAALGRLDPGCRIGFFADAGAEIDGFGRAEAARIHRIPGPPWLERLGPDAAHLRQHVFWPPHLAALPFELLHFCSQTDAPARLAKPYVLTVLDLIPHRMADAYRRGKSRLRYGLARALERRAIRGARGLLAISEHTKQDVVRLAGVPEDRVVVTPLAVREGLAPPTEPETAAFCRRHQLDRGYLLYVGGIDARKNLPFLLEVLRVLAAERSEVELVIAGRYRDDPDFPELVARIQRLGLEKAVRLAGFVAEEELPALYAAASLFVYPSLYEGFGLPPLEAMACGTAVLAADRTSLPEVLGHAAMFADPEDVGEFADAVRGLLDHPERRRELREAGLRRARAFTWEATARATLEAYRRFAPPERSDPARERTEV